MECAECQPLAEAGWGVSFPPRAVAGGAKEREGTDAEVRTGGQRPPRGPLFSAAPASVPEWPFVWAHCAQGHADHFTDLISRNPAAALEGAGPRSPRGGVESSGGSGREALTRPSVAADVGPTVSWHFLLPGRTLGPGGQGQLASWQGGLEVTEAHQGESSGLSLRRM